MNFVQKYRNKKDHCTKFLSLEVIVVRKNEVNKKQSNKLMEGQQQRHQGLSRSDSFMNQLFTLLQVILKHKIDRTK